MESELKHLGRTLREYQKMVSAADVKNWVLLRDIVLKQNVLVEAVKSYLAEYLQ